VLLAAGCLPLQAGSRRLLATAACCKLLPIPPSCHPSGAQRSAGSSSCRKTG